MGAGRPGKRAGGALIRELAVAGAFQQALQNGDKAGMARGWAHYAGKLAEARASSSAWPFIGASRLLPGRCLPRWSSRHTDGGGVLEAGALSARGRVCRDV
ncbi:hypothetical protein [Verrucomicrobium spinosum]|uniref:hypothetical protein n=1 Tax=Verrucomicrobium spinosum TaxID=2736 RepID=UPI000B2A498A|nr:hypothetical protein [Verrucomicrobium spinosum]